MNAPPSLDTDPLDERPSKSQRKREMTALQVLGVALVNLGPDQLKRIDLPDDLREAIVAARRISAHEGRRRQIQYVGRLMRGVDPEPIQRALADLTGGSRESIELMHRCERWRDRLIDDDAALTELLAAHPGIDVQPMRALIRAARRERTTNSPPKSARELYRWIHEALQKADA
jgi:ribosome-associated protein